MRRLYLDHNATTPLAPEVLEVMQRALRDGFGNPSSLHFHGQQARALVETARAQVAALVNAAPSELFFTSGGTEADNTALRGLVASAPPGRSGLVHSAIEHHAVTETAKALAGEGVDVKSVRATEAGVVDLAALDAAVGASTGAVALMLANNETGVVQPVAEAVAMARARGARLHCDAVQAAGKIPVDVKALDVDTLALSAHKLYGPQGTGALYVKRGVRLTALLRGGSQERNRRAGTENVAGIVGFGRAAELALASLASEARREAELRDRLEARLLLVEGCRRNGDAPRVPNTPNLSFEGCEAESLLLALDLAGVAASTGAACAAGAIEPSHVLRGMGLSSARVQSSLRFSLGRGTSEADVDRAAELVAEAVARQRRMRALTT